MRIAPVNIFTLMTEGLETVLDKDDSRTTMVSCTDAIEEYVKKSDWRVNANANSGYCNASLVNNLAGKITANYWLDKVYSKEEGDAHRNADYHIHDLDCLCPYCCGHDLQRLLNEGFNGVVDKVEANAPKHFREALYQMANYLGILQAEWAGAQAFSSFDTYLAPYVFFDRFYNGMTYTDIKKAILNFIYTLNVPARWGQCVPSTYRCLKGDGTWVTYQELKDGDEIYVVDMETGTLKKDKITNVNIFNAPPKMHEYKDKHGFNFKVTPNHRVIYKVGSGGYQIKESKELTRYDVVGKAVINIPTAQWGTYSNEEIAEDEYDISDDLLKLVTYIMTDGVIAKQKGRSAQISWFKSPKRDGIKQFEELCSRLKIEYNRRKDDSSRADGAFVYEYRLHVSDVTNKVSELLGDDKHKFPKFVQYLSPRQCNLMLDIWTNTDGHKDTEHWKLQADSEDIQDMLAYLSVRTGKPVSNTKRSIGKNEKATIYTDIHKNINRECHVEEIEMSLSKVWCPTTNTGTFVCMTDEGYIFLTGNSPFTNVTIDWQVPTDMKTQVPLRNDMPYFESIFDSYLFDNPEKFKDEKFLSLVNAALHRLGRQVGFSYERDDSPGNDDATKALICDVIEEVLNELTYEHFQEEMNLINKAFYECMNDGDKTGKPFTFPIPTVSITEDFDWDGENTDLLFENAAKYGSSYFQNFIGSQYFRDENGKLTIPNPNAFSPDAVRSMCCRLQLDLTQLRQKGGGLFGSGSQTGSIGVVTINMARLGYKHKGDIKALYADLDRLLDLAKSTLEKKRAFVYELNKRGLYPYTRRYIRTLDTFFSTIGVNGMNEMVRNFTNDEHDITDKFGHDMCLEMLTHIRNRLVEYQNTTGNLYNLEATPAEGTTYRLAKADKQRYGQKTKTYIECDVHGRVEVDASDDSEYIECPLCREESNV